MCKMYRRAAHVFDVHTHAHIVGKFQQLALKSAVLPGHYNTFAHHRNRMERAEIVTADKLYFVSSDDKCTYQRDLTIAETTKVASWRYDLRNVFNIFADGKHILPWSVLEISNELYLKNASQTWDITNAKLQYVDARFCIMNVGDRAKIVDHLGELEIDLLHSHRRPLVYRGYHGHGYSRPHYFMNPAEDVTYEVTIK